MKAFINDKQAKTNDKATVQSHKTTTGVNTKAPGSGNQEINRFRPFFFKSLIWLALTFLIANQFATDAFWIVVLSVFLFSIPISLCGIYGNTVHQIRRLTIFAEKGRLYKLISGRPLKVILWICWALGASFFMLVQFHTYSSLEWFVFFTVVPVFWSVYIITRRLIVHEIKPYLVTDMALRWARRLSPLIMLVIYVVLIVHFGNTPEYPSVQKAIDAQKAAVADMTGSAVVMEVSWYLANYEGFKAYAIGRLGEQDAFWALALLGIGGLVVFYNACAMLSCFLIPGTEYRRIFGPLSDADKPQPLSNSRIAAIVAVFTFLALFIYVPMFGYIEAYVQQTPQIAKARQNAESYIIPKLEQIDDALFKPGTLAQLQDARLEALRNVEISLVHLDSQADLAFDHLETRVDSYLDWYYSLVGEYARIANLLIGELEDYMSEKLEESFQQGEAFREVQAAIDNALVSHENALKIYQHTAEKIMKENRIIPSGSPIQVIQQMSLKDVLNPPIHQDIIGLQHRMAAGGGGGALAGVITAVVIKKIIGKIASKSVLKIAAKALTKVVVSKTAGTAAGAGAGAISGAAVGSVIPVLGTATGAAVGGIIGAIGAGVTVDKHSSSENG